MLTAAVRQGIRTPFPPAGHGHLPLAHGGLVKPDSIVSEVYHPAREKSRHFSDGPVAMSGAPWIAEENRRRQALEKFDGSGHRRNLYRTRTRLHRSRTGHGLKLRRFRAEPAPNLHRLAPGCLRLSDAADAQRFCPGGKLPEFLEVPLQLPGGSGFPVDDISHFMAVSRLDIEKSGQNIALIRNMTACALRGFLHRFPAAVLRCARDGLPGGGDRKMPGAPRPAFRYRDRAGFRCPAGQSDRSYRRVGRYTLTLCGNRPVPPGRKRTRSQPDSHFFLRFVVPGSCEEARLRVSRHGGGREALPWPRPEAEDSVRGYFMASTAS